MPNPFIIFSAALLDSINPCAISVLLLTIGFLLSLSKPRKEVIKIGSVYIFGVFIVYILIGLGILKALSFFGIPHSLAKAGALIIIASGALGLAEKIIPNFPIKLKIPQSSHPQIAKLINKASIPGFLALGGLVAMYEFPCTGGPYLGILALLYNKTTFLSGLGYLVFYNFVFILPLILILGIASSSAFLQKLKAWRRRNSLLVGYGSSLGMIALGVVILLTT